MATAREREIEKEKQLAEMLDKLNYIYDHIKKLEKEKEKKNV